MGYIAFNANTVTAQDGGAITGTSINVGSGAVTGGAITGTTSLTTPTINNSGGTVMQFNGSPKLQTLNTGVTITGVITGTSLTTGAGSITGGAITGTSLTTGAGSITGGAINGSSLTITGAGSISTSIGTISTGGAINGATISGTTSIQTPKSIIGSSNSSDNIITIAKRITVTTVLNTKLNVTVSGGESVSTYLELVASGASSGVGNASRYSLYNISYPPPNPWTAALLSNYQNGVVGATPNWVFLSSGTTLVINANTTTNTWTGTVFAKLWNGTGVPGTGSWTIAIL